MTIARRFLLSVFFRKATVSADLTTAMSLSKWPHFQGARGV